MRIFSILHLCFVFSVICWTVATPFTEELYHDRTLKTAYNIVMGDKHLAQKFPDQKDKLSQFHTFFVNLPVLQQDAIKTGYANLQEKISTGAWTKTKSALSLLFFDLPLFKRAWIFFSVILAVMALKERQGIRQAIWILPVLTCCYVGDQSLMKEDIHSTAMEQLIPQESVLAEKYLGHPIEGGIEEQRQQLQTAWEKYLVDVWSPKFNSDSDKLLSGEYSFSVARLKALKSDFSDQRQQQSLDSAFALLCYLAWNLFYAWKIGVRRSAVALEPHGT
jgi:hypothetical protein